MLCASLLAPASVLRRAPWMRTRPTAPRIPSEWTVRYALRTTFGEFLAGWAKTSAWVKFLSRQIPPAFLQTVA